MQSSVYSVDLLSEFFFLLFVEIKLQILVFSWVWCLYVLLFQPIGSMFKTVLSQNAQIMIKNIKGLHSVWIFLSICHLQIFQLAVMKSGNFNRLRGHKVNKINYIYLYICVWVFPLRLSDHSFREGVPSVCVCVCVCVCLIACVHHSQKWSGLGPSWAVAPRNKNLFFASY